MSEEFKDTKVEIDDTMISPPPSRKSIDSSSCTNPKAPVVGKQTWWDLKLPATLCIAASFAGFIFGWDVGTVGGISNLQGFKNRFGNATNPETGAIEFNSFTIGLIISIFNIGSALGGLTLPKIADKLGRKVVIFISVTIYVIGLVVQMTSVSSSSWVQFLVGRIITGFAVGSTSVLTPMFISESAPISIRGSLVTFYQIMITLGILLGNVINFGCKQSYPNSDKQWLIPISIGFAGAALTALGTSCMPESAAYKINRHDDVKGARLSFAKLNNVTPDSELAEYEVGKIIMTKAECQAAVNNAGKWHEFITGSPKLARRLFIGIGVMFFQQFSGANYFFYYGTTLFSSVGIADPYVTAMILAGVNFVATPGGAYLVEKFGRKSCLLVGSILMFCCMLIYACLGSFALVEKDGSDNKTVGTCMIVFTCIYIIGFATTWGPVAFVVVSEIFPVRVKASSMAISTSINWLSNFLISLFTPFVTKQIGFNLGFVFAACLLVATFFVWFFVPETKDLGIEDVDELFRSGNQKGATKGYDV